MALFEGRDRLGNNDAERRAHPRVPFELAARLWTDSTVFEAETLDLSLGGARLRVESGPDDLAPGARCVISFALGDGPCARSLELRSSLVHHGDQEYGVRFRKMGEVTSRRLFRMILHSSGVETLLRREFEDFRAEESD